MRRDGQIRLTQDGRAARPRTHAVDSSQGARRGWARLARLGGVAILAGFPGAGGRGVKIFREKLGLSQDELDDLLEKAFTTAGC